jgi:hypothetical protein
MRVFAYSHLLRAADACMALLPVCCMCVSSQLPLATSQVSADRVDVW